MAARCLLLTENAHWEEHKGIPYRLTGVLRGKLREDQKANEKPKTVERWDALSRFWSQPVSQVLKRYV
jgi:hypothetical protein